MPWDLWLDYHRRDSDGLMHGNIRNARSELELTPGPYVVVGNAQTEAAIAEVVRAVDHGVVLDDNRALRGVLPNPR